jgi:hypothetical protein
VSVSGLVAGRTSRLAEVSVVGVTLRTNANIALWTNSYFVATGGPAPASVLTRHVESQKSR